MKRLLCPPLFLLLIPPLFGAATHAGESVRPAFAEFFSNLEAECTNAYTGALLQKPDFVRAFTGTEEMQMHFRECSGTELRIPLHVENETDDSWNRSRTWILTLHDDGLELRHDHRNADGSDSANTMYGGFSVGEGTDREQLFQSLPRTEEAGEFRGWRIIYEPGQSYTYGTTSLDGYIIAFTFDLSETIDAPPAPWGHE